MVQLTSGLKGSHVGFQNGSLINLLTYLLTTYCCIFMSHAREELAKAALYILQQWAYDCREEEAASALNSGAVLRSKTFHSSSTRQLSWTWVLEMLVLIYVQSLHQASFKMYVSSRRLQIQTSIFMPVALTDAPPTQMSGYGTVLYMHRGPCT